MVIESGFRPAQNILTSKYPAKGPELLQYNPTIHSASTTYTWENVYSYDKEFRRHVSHHPTRSWSVILQQAWTMLLKDRATRGDGYFQRGSHKIKGIKSPASASIKAGVPLGCLVSMIITAQLRSVGNSVMEHMSVDSGTIMIVLELNLTWAERKEVKQLKSNGGKMYPIEAYSIGFFFNYCNDSFLVNDRQLVITLQMELAT